MFQSIIFLLFPISCGLSLQFRFGDQNPHSCRGEFGPYRITGVVTSNGTEQLFHAPFPVSYSLQTCFMIANNPLLVCRHEFSGEIIFILIELHRSRAVLTNKPAIFVRFDHLRGDRIATYDGSKIEKFALDPNLERLFKANPLETIPFSRDISEISLQNNSIFVTLNRTRHRINQKGGLSSSEERIIEPVEVQSLFNPTPTILVALLEALILVFIGLYCRWKIYRTSSGRLYFEPQQPSHGYNLRPRKESIKEDLRALQSDNPYQS